MTISTGGGRFRARRLRRLLWPLRLVAGAAITSGCYLAAWRMHLVHDESWQHAAIIGAIAGCAASGAVSLTVRWQGGPEAQRAAQRALRRKRIPDDVDSEVVRRGLEGIAEPDAREARR